MIDRITQKELTVKLQQDNKIIVLYGARRVGKTTLITKILREQQGAKILAINADEIAYREVFSSMDFRKMNQVVSGYDILFIDEAQRIPDIGVNLKILHDALPQLKIIVTGSSSFELANHTKESLTGRAWTYTLYPISVPELRNNLSWFDIDRRLEELLIYGAYPEVINKESLKEKREYLLELSSSYLYKDILEIGGIRHASKIHDLLKLLSFQVGSLVSIKEIGTQIGLNRDTVESYIDLLEQSFVVFRLKGFSRNLRKEITKMDKIYFYDLGIRNILIDNLKPFSYRDDQGKLWENFLIAERKKKLAYARMPASSYFWRTYTRLEIDYIEESNGELAGYECKYGKKKGTEPKTWKQAYPQATFQTITPDNYHDFL